MRRPSHPTSAMSAEPGSDPSAVPMVDIPLANCFIHDYSQSRPRPPQYLMSTGGLSCQKASDLPSRTGGMVEAAHGCGPRDSGDQLELRPSRWRQSPASRGSATPRARLVHPISFAHVSPCDSLHGCKNDPKDSPYSRFSSQRSQRRAVQRGSTGLPALHGVVDPHYSGRRYNSTLDTSLKREMAGGSRRSTSSPSTSTR